MHWEEGGGGVGVGGGKRGGGGVKEGGLRGGAAAQWRRVKVGLRPDTNQAVQLVEPAALA